MPFENFHLNDAEGAKKAARQVGRMGCRLFLMLAILALWLAFVGPYTEFLWFAHDLQRTDVLLLPWKYRTVLFLIGAAVSWIVLYFSMNAASRMSLIYTRQPSTQGEAVVSKLIGWLQQAGRRGAIAISLVFAVFLGWSFSGNWEAAMLARHGSDFGKVEPMFGRDVAFYAFQLPWLEAIASTLFSLFFVATSLVGAMYFGMGLMASMGKIELSRPRVRQQMGLLLAGLALSLAWMLWLGRFDYGVMESSQFTGPGYSASMKQAVQGFLAAWFAVSAVLVLINIRVGKAYAGVMIGGSGAGLIYLIGMVIYPSTVQRFSVEPDKLTIESPFATKAIEMTRWAYGLDKMQTRPFEARTGLTSTERDQTQATLQDLRLWDPDVLQDAIEGLQGLKPYYTFHDVDIDRYDLQGRSRMVMVSTRDMNLAGLSDQARTWLNQRLQYTHGFGVVMTDVNASKRGGQPEFLIQDVPPTSTGGPQVIQPRIYFDDARDSYGAPTSEYAIVSAGAKEFDYPSQADQNAGYRWTGTRGVPIGGYLARLAFSVRLGDGNLAVSNNIQSGSKLLWRRNVLERSMKLLPFLKFDSDPYAVIIKGQILWVLDAYTASSRVPYSAMAGEGDAEINYIRNSVKVVVDAYSGDVTAYAVIPDDPVLKAWRSVYPGLVQDLDKMDPELKGHFRYAEDMFMLQAAQLTQYHVTDPQAFLKNEDAWDMPTELGRTGATEPMKAYYVRIRVPLENKDEFLLILPFTPRGKQNMSGWLAGRCDGDHYGELLMYKFSQKSVMEGPAQMESMMNVHPPIAQINRDFNNDQSRIVPGNLLVIPVGGTILYVKPLFLQSRTTGIQAIPELKRVALAMGGKIVLGDSFEDALRQLFGDATDLTGKPPTKPPANGQTPIVAPTAIKALELFDAAQAALKAGDFARYGELQKQLRAELERLRGQQPSSGPEPAKKEPSGSPAIR